MNTVKLYYPEDQPNVTVASIEGSIGFRYGWDAHSKGRPIEEPPTAEQLLARLIYDGRVTESDSTFHLEVLTNNLDELQSDFRDGWNARRKTFAAIRVAAADTGHGSEANVKRSPLTPYP